MIWWCLEHKANGRIDRRLVPPDALVIEKVNGEWPRGIVTLVASEISYPRVASEGHERKVVAALDALVPLPDRGSE